MTKDVDAILTTKQKDSKSGILHTIIGVGGLAGCGIAALILVFRNVLAGQYLSELLPEHSAAIVGLVVIATFFIAVVAMFTWLINHPNRMIGKRASSFLLLIVILMGSVLVALWRLVSPPGVEQPTNLELGILAYKQSKFDAARRYLTVHAQDFPGDAEGPLWLGRVALEESEYRLARRHFQNSLDRNDELEAARIELLIVVLLDSNDRKKALDNAVPKAPSELVSRWLTCADNKGLTKPDKVLTLWKLRAECPVDS